MLKKIVLILVAIALTACNMGSSSTTPDIAPVPVAPTAQSYTVTSLPTDLEAEAWIVNPDGTMTPGSMTDIQAIPNPAPWNSTIDDLYLTADQPDIDAFIQALKDEVALQSSSSSGHMAMFSPVVLRGADCNNQASQIIAHVLNDINRMDPNLKFGGSVLWYLERLIEKMTGQEGVVLRGFVQGSNGNAAVWISWFDNLSSRYRETMILLGNKPWLGSIYPMGEPAVVGEYGPLAAHVIAKFQTIAGYSNGYADPNAVVSLSIEALAMIGGGTALGFGISKFEKNAGTISNAMKVWGECFKKALNDNPKYKKWKEDSNKPQSYALASQSGIVMTFPTQEEALKGAVVLTGVVVGVVIVVKLAACFGAGQCWVILIPTPAGSSCRENTSTKRARMRCLSLALG